MIIGIGTDIVDCRRIERVYKKFGDKFLKHVLTEKEKMQMPQAKQLVQFIASRFAAKEATVKALGTGFTNGISCTSIEVLRETDKAPSITFLDKAQEKAIELNISHAHVSYSHEKEYAVAYVILVSDTSQSSRF